MRTLIVPGRFTWLTEHAPGHLARQVAAPCPSGGRDSLPSWSARSLIATSGSSGGGGLRAARHEGDARCSRVHRGSRWGRPCR